MYFVVLRRRNINHEVYILNSVGLGTIGLGVILLIRGRGNGMGSDQSRANRRNDSLSGSTGSNGTTPTKYDVYQSNNSTLSRDRSGHEGEHFAMQRSSKLITISFVGFILNQI